MIAKEAAEKLAGSAVFKEAEAVAPGFLNLKLSEEYLLNVVSGMAQEPKFGLELPETPKKIIIDYGGANVAKPLTPAPGGHRGEHQAHMPLCGS